MSLYLSLFDAVDELDHLRRPLEPAASLSLESDKAGIARESVFFLGQTWKSTDTLITIAMSYEIRPLPVSPASKLILRSPSVHEEVVISLPDEVILQSSSLSQRVVPPD